MVKFVLYLIRWQLSTLILAPVVAFFKHSTSMVGTREDWTAAVVANLIGGCVFYNVDRFIFKSSVIEKWEFLKHGKCHDCGVIDYVRRLVIAPGYDRSDDDSPEFRCVDCSAKKLECLIKLKVIGDLSC